MEVSYLGLHRSCVRWGHSYLVGSRTEPRRDPGRGPSTLELSHPLSSSHRLHLKREGLDVLGGRRPRLGPPVPSTEVIGPPFPGPGVASTVRAPGLSRDRCVQDDRSPGTSRRGDTEAPPSTTGLPPRGWRERSQKPKSSVPSSKDPRRTDAHSRRDCTHRPPCLLRLLHLLQKQSPVSLCTGRWGNSPGGADGTPTDLSQYLSVKGYVSQWICTNRLVPRPWSEAVGTYPPEGGPCTTRTGKEDRTAGVHGRRARHRHRTEGPAE